MKRNLFLTAVLIALFTNAFNAQTTFDFEDLTIPVNGYWNGSDETGYFGNDEIYFPNDYNATYQSWSGFSYAYDTITSDAQFASYTPERKAFSGNSFGIAFVPSDWESGTYENIPVKIGFNNTKIVSSVYIANDSTTVDVIVNGNSYGTEPFSEEDYFKIIISGIRGTNYVEETVEYYLADYRSGLSFIENNWHETDLSSLGAIDTLVFNLESSDTGAYGMNTPAYFCFDDISFSDASFVENNSDIKVNIYPNPAKSIVNINSIYNADIVISDITGKIVLSKNKCPETERIDVSNFKSGIYFVKILNSNDIISKKLIIE